MTDRLTYADKNHPPIPSAKIGIILANLGTPDATDYWSMRRYLHQFLSDRRVIDYAPWYWQPLLQLIILSKRPFSSGAAYRNIWNKDLNESPLLTITRAQTKAVRAALKCLYKDRFIIDFAMRYGNPAIVDVIKLQQQHGAEKIIFFPLYPQYAGATTASANDEVFRALMTMPWQPAIRTVSPYYDHPLYINALANSITEAVQNLDHKPDIVVVSYHGMPQRYLMGGDPYHCQCHKTTRLLREMLGWDESAMCMTFQSKFGPEDWLLPATVDEVARLARTGARKIAVIAPAFSADCVETLEEINQEIKESFCAAGGEKFTYIPCLNHRAKHIDMMIEILKSELAGWI